MAHIDLVRPHALGLAGARRAAEAVALDLEREHGLRPTWEGDTLRVDGPGVHGTLTAGPDAVRVVVRLGLAMRPFRRALQAEIERQLDAAVGQPA